MPVNEHKNIVFDMLTHPRFRALRHLFIITIFLFVSIGQSLFTFGSQAETLGNRIYWYGMGNTVVMILFFYLNLYVLVPQLLLKNKYMEYLIVLLAQISIYVIIKWIVEYYMLRRLGVVRDFTAVTVLDGISNLTLYTICIASSSVTTFFKQWMADTQRINDLENNRLKGSVDEIKSHINPKSLSNVLSYAAEKVKTDSNEVSDILFRLSDVLRYELYDCKREKVLLESDIAFIDKYLSLERLNRSVGFTYTISCAVKPNLLISPFIFMPVIQKVMEQQPTDMLISFNIDNNLLIFNCKVSGADLTKCDFSKEEQRLSILYRETIEIDKNSESVDLRLNV